MENVVKQVDAALIYIIVFSFFLLLLIMTGMIYFAVRYRASKNPEASEIRGNVKVELAWMIIPMIIALSMFYFGWESFLGLRNVPPGAINIDVDAMQFTYIFKYPNMKESEGLMVVPQGKPVKVTLTSLDVIHGFFIPAFRIKMDALENVKTYAWFYADKPGEYDIFCTEYCGVDHARMTAKLRIVSEAEYQTWLNKK